MEVPDGGRLIVDGRVTCDETQHNRSRILRGRELRDLRTEVGMVFQHFNLFPHMTVMENIVEAPMSVRGMSRPAAEEIAADLLGQVGLPEKSRAYPAQLSGGQRQRVAIARALAIGPAVMLFDEVTSSVDPELAGEILFVMRRLAERGMTMLVVTHEMKFAADVADRVVFLDGGEVLESGGAHDVLDRPTHPRTQKFLRAVVDREPMDALSLPEVT